MTGTYNATSDKLEITFLFNHTVHAGRYIWVIRKGNGNKEVQKLRLKACGKVVSLFFRVICEDDIYHFTIRTPLNCFKTSFDDL